MSQGNQEDNSDGQTIPAVLTVPGANKKRSWLRIVVVVVVIMGIIAAFRMWYDTQRLEQLNRRMPGLPESPRNNAVNEPIRKGPQRVIHPET